MTSGVGDDLFVAVRPLPGSGPAVLAVHGAEGSWREGEPLAGHLRDRVRILALDLPWRAGNQGGWWASGSAGDWFARAAALVDQPVHAVLGHSLGANAILENLAKAGGPGLAAVLFAPFFRAPHHVPGEPLYLEFVAAFRYAVEGGLRHRLGERLGKLGEPLLQRMVDSTLKRMGTAAIRVLYGHFVATADLDLASVTTPALALADQADPALAGQRGAALGTAMPAAVLAYEEGPGHCLHVTAAALMAGKVTAFLRGAGVLGGTSMLNGEKL